MTTSSSRFATAAMLLTVSAVTVNASMGGFQSGPSKGPFYSGGMTLVRNQNRAFLTGSHYNTVIEPHDMTKNDQFQGTELDTASSCYLAKVDFDEVTNDNDNTYHSLTDWVSYGNEGKIETCSAVTATKNSDVYVVGSVAEGGLFSDGYPMQGLLSILDQETLGFVDATLIKSAEDPSTHMIYPLDLIHDTGRAFVYIAALTSTDATKNEITGNKDHPNWQEQHQLGSSFDVTVIKIHTPKGSKPSALWVKHFPLDVEPDGTTPPVFVAGLALQRDTNDIQHLLISGSTRGSGEAFGKVAANTVDEDGFVMQLALKDGSFIQKDRHQGKVYDYESDLREGTSSDDFIRGMCNNRGRSGHNDELMSDFFYIVGGTKGDMTTDDQGIQNNDNDAGFQFGAEVEEEYATSWDRSGSLMPFLRQVGIDDLKPTWTTQWAAMPSKTNGKALPTNAFAMDCYVDDDDKAIFVVGSVMKDAKMAQGNVEMFTQGGDDIWVAKVDEATGNVFWLTQLGSQGDEKLARHGSIAVNFKGDVVIYGDTNGSLYRPRSPDEDPSTTDMFIMTLDAKTGAVLDDIYMGGTSSGSVASTINGVPPVVSVPPQPSRTKAPAKPSDDVPNPNVNTNPNKGVQANNVNKKSDSKVGLIFIILFAISAVLAGLYFFMTRQMKKRKAENQKSSIFSCLQQFDVEDIDLRRSPPGGWHGTYMNKLATGHNNADDTVFVGDSPTDGGSGSADGALLTHSSVANDALFMEDAAAAPGSGYRDGEFQIDDETDEDDVDIRLKGNSFV
jgi:hypothetical protein